MTGKDKTGDQLVASVPHGPGGVLAGDAGADASDGEPVRKRDAEPGGARAGEGAASAAGGAVRGGGAGAADAAAEAAAADTGAEDGVELSDEPARGR